MKRRLLGGAAVAAGLVLALSPAAHAAPAATPQATSPVKASATRGGAAISLEVGASTIAKARLGAKQARAGAREKADLKALRQELARRAAGNGQTYLDGDTESFVLSDGVSMAVPKGLDVSSVSVRTEGGKVVADVVSEDTSTTASARQGQGMASWTTLTSGTYVIKISGAGFMESKWLKRKLTGGDGSSKYDYVAMRRTGLGQPYEIGGLNYSVTGLYISVHSTDATRANAVDRIDQAPQQDFTGNCKGSYNIGVSAYGVSAGGTFADCDKNDISFSTTDPGYYRNYMTQGAVFNGGNRAVGFQIAVKIKQGTSLNFTSYQRLEMARYVYPAKKCSTWDSGKTCS
ncbi:hypothetical protein [Terrabacter sp. NPDC000476]|uniref:hypothetical protein n=1 Tax=Terrabacter sp. NPDC000476 TaxID=3154258 RepID=UPI00332BEE03